MQYGTRNVHNSIRQFNKNFQLKVEQKNDFIFHIKISYKNGLGGGYPELRALIYFSE